MYQGCNIVIQTCDYDKHCNILGHPESNYRVIKLCNRAAASACEIFTILCDCHTEIPINTQDYVCITNRIQIQEWMFLVTFNTNKVEAKMHLIVCLCLELLLEANNVINYAKSHI